MMSSKQKESWRIIVVELSESIPRRREDKEPLYVSVCRGSLEDRFQQLIGGEGPSELSGTYAVLRPDLIADSPTFALKRRAIKECRREKLRLARLGHSINGDASKWIAYVVDLDPTGVTGTEVGYVYVGQTSKTAEERFAIHKGPKPAPPARDLRAKIVHRRGTGLNRELMSSLKPQPPVYTLEDALRLERTWAKKLAAKGYRVEAGDATPGRHGTKEEK